MSVVGTLTILVTVLCYHHVFSTGAPNWDLSKPVEAHRRRVYAYDGILHKDAAGHEIPLSGVYWFFYRGFVNFGFGEHEHGPVQAMLGFDEKPFVLDEGTAYTIDENEFAKYGISHWEPPQSRSKSPQLSVHHQSSQIPSSSQTHEASQLPSSSQTHQPLSPNPQIQYRSSGLNGQSKRLRTSSD